MEIEKIKKELLESFDKLSLSDKRNEYIKEVIALSTYVNMMLAEFGETDVKVPRNYNPAVDDNKSEEELLTYNYEDLIDIKNSLLLAISYLNTK